MTTFESSPPSPGSPRPGGPDDADVPEIPSEVDRLHAELSALTDELPELLGKVEDAASDDG